LGDAPNRGGLTPPPTEAYAMFSGEINQDTTRKIFDSVTAASAQGFSQVHLLFQSYGGFVGDGISLYNFFKTLPLELTIYNTGAIHSIAAIAYLGARKGKASARAAFMIHTTRTGTGTVNARPLAFRPSQKL
jgi:ATP-dependent Clp protease protease subunit